MAFPLDPSEPVKVVNAEIVPAPLQGCPFEYEDGSHCLDLKVFARGFCTKHYQQLRRLGAFEKKRTSTDIEAIGNIEEERLEKALSILQRASPHAARQWVKSTKVAANKGDHKPALGLLLHAGAIKPIEKSSPSNTPSAFTVNIGVALAGVKTDADK